jgi:hypothetical protein
MLQAPSAPAVQSCEPMPVTSGLDEWGNYINSKQKQEYYRLRLEGEGNLWKPFETIALLSPHLFFLFLGHEIVLFYDNDDWNWDAAGHCLGVWRRLESKDTFN